MPVLISPPAPYVPPPVVTPENDRELDFRSIDGSQSIAWTGTEYIIQSGIQGLAIPPRDIVTQDIPGLDGTRLVEIRTQPRSVVLPFYVISDSQQPVTHRAQLAAIRSFLNYRSNDYATDEGTFDLVAKSTGGERLLRCVYSDGMEGSDGTTDGSGFYWATFDTKLIAVQPYWRGDEWTTPIVGTGTGAAFVSNSLDWPRAISASVALGANMTVEVGGDVPSPANIILTAPFTTATITSPQGLNVVIGAVSSGALSIRTGRDRAVTLDGSPAWNLVGDAPQWQPLPPGTADISIVVTGATSDTSARVFGTSLWETAW